MVNKKALHCRRHAIKTPEHIAKIAAVNRGRKRTPEQRQRLSAAKRGAGSLDRTCEYCGQQFTVQKPSAKQRFCSKACGYANRKGSNATNWLEDMPHMTCRVCGKNFRLPSKTIKGKRYTCSYTCKNVWQKTHQKNKATNIEQVTEKALKERGWCYESQVGLCNIVVVDFYLPNSKIAIFCDGDYWHSLPGKAKRDQRQTEILNQSGYTVYRFLGSEILADIDRCLAQIKHP
jgi:very-short-patch-repair endonuclease